jgi:hypothetical protein
MGMSLRDTPNPEDNDPSPTASRLPLSYGRELGGARNFRNQMIRRGFSEGVWRVEEIPPTMQGL